MTNAMVYTFWTVDGEAAGLWQEDAEGTGQLLSEKGGCGEWSPLSSLCSSSEGLLGEDSRFFAHVRKNLCGGQGLAGHSWAKPQLSNSV